MSEAERTARAPGSGHHGLQAKDGDEDADCIARHAKVEDAGEEAEGRSSTKWGLDARRTGEELPERSQSC